MPTPKQVRFHYGRIRKAWKTLARCLNDAHTAKVLMYEAANYSEQSPCSTNFETDHRIDQTTEKALAQAMRDEIEKSIRRKRKAKK